MVVVAGVLLWGINWWGNRPLFIDEANVARNLYDRTFAGLFWPLDHRQYAPPLYLALAKACGELFGYGERSLRGPALLGGALAVVGMIVGGKALKLGWWILLPLVLLFVNPVVLRYVSEVKPYALDLGLAALFLAWGLRGGKPGWKIIVAGVVGIWASLPLIFVLAAVGLHRFLPSLFRPFPRTGGRAPLPWIVTGICWLSSFAVLYFTVLEPSVGSNYLNIYHGRYFFPLPGSEGFTSRATDLLMSFPKLAFGFTAMAIAAGTLAGFSALAFRKTAWLLLPAGLVIIGSAFGFYSLIPRLLLFTLPGWWLAAGWLSKRFSERFSGWPTWLLVGGWVLILGGTNVGQHYFSPQKFSDARRLVRELQPDFTPVLHHSAEPVYDYYTRINPPRIVPKSATTANIRAVAMPGNYVVLYDVTTQGNVRESLRQDSIWAAERGCEVRTEAMFRASTLYVSCPSLDR